mmetsp:Transcript_14528/g.47004  ORF Transcript_14528/g.47004 Transcript_14528/m.47004 type:complete len:207 (+) Transcript_14528:502-1122(+)
MVGPQGGRRRGPLLRRRLRQGRLREGLQGVPGEARGQHPEQGRRAALPRDLVLRRGRRREVDRRHRGRERRRQRSHGRRGRRRRGDLRQLRLQGHRRPHDGRQTPGPRRVPPLVRRNPPHDRRQAGFGLLRRRDDDDGGDVGPELPRAHEKGLQEEEEQGLLQVEVQSVPDQVMRVFLHQEEVQEERVVPLAEEGREVQVQSLDGS